MIDTGDSFHNMNMLNETAGHITMITKQCHVINLSAIANGKPDHAASESAHSTRLSILYDFSS